MDIKVIVWIVGLVGYYGFKYWQEQQKKKALAAAPNPVVPQVASQSSEPRAKPVPADVPLFQSEIQQSYEADEEKVVYTSLEEIYTKNDNNNLEGGSLLSSQPISVVNLARNRHKIQLKQIQNDLKNASALKRSLVISEILKPRF